MPDSSIIEGNSSFVGLSDSGRVKAQADSDKTRCKGPNCFFGHAVKAASRSKVHEVVLQVLNRWFDHGDKEVYYGVDNFTGTGPAWDVSPLIYAQVHPDHNLVKSDIDAALKSVKTAEGEEGRLCGALKNIDVMIPGQPRLAGGVVFDDPEIEARYEKGELSLSTAFECSTDPSNLLANTAVTQGKLKGKITPNHVLVFKQDDDNQPGDPGAMFLHQKEDSNVTEFDNAGRVISQKNASRFEEAIKILQSLWREMTTNVSPAESKKAKPEEEDEKVKAEHRAGTKDEQPDEEDETMEDEKVRTELDRMRTEIDNMKKLVEDKQKEIDTLVADNKAMKEKLDTADQEKAETEWKHLKESQIPPAWLKGDGAEDAQRKEYETDKVAYMHKVLEHRKAGATPEEGEGFDHTAGKKKEEDEKSPAAVAMELRKITGRM